MDPGMRDTPFLELPLDESILGHDGWRDRSGQVRSGRNIGLNWWSRLCRKRTKSREALVA
jgi:hypothetical protein